MARPFLAAQARNERDANLLSRIPEKFGTTNNPSDGVRASSRTIRS